MISRTLNILVFFFLANLQIIRKHKKFIQFLNNYFKLQEQALKVSDKLSAARKLKLFDGITLLNNNPKEARSLEDLSEDPALRKRQVSEKLWERSSALLQSTELELSYAGADDDEQESRSINDEGIAQILNIQSLYQYK